MPESKAQSGLGKKNYKTELLNRLSPNSLITVSGTMSVGVKELPYFRGLFFFFLKDETTHLNVSGNIK